MTPRSSRIVTLFALISLSTYSFAQQGPGGGGFDNPPPPPPPGQGGFGGDQGPGNFGPGGGPGGRGFGGPGFGGPGGGFGRGGPGGGRGMGRGFQGATQFTDVKAQLRSTDEEWKVIAPLLQKVAIARQAADPAAGNGGPQGGPGGFGGPGGRGGRGRGGGNDPFNGPANDTGGGRGMRGGPGRGGMRGRGGDFQGQGFGGPGGDFNQNQEQLPPPPPQPARPALAQPGQPQEEAARNNPAAAESRVSGKTGTLAQAMADLQAATADRSTSSERLKELVQQVRTARTRAQADFETAQSHLRLVLTPDQEATLVGLGYLD